MINTFKKLLSLVLCVSIMLIFSATSGMAQTSSGTPVNPRDEALKKKQQTSTETAMMSPGYVW